MTSKQVWLTNEQVQTLNERHSWFKHGDAQSNVSRAFANDAVEAHERLRAAAPELLAALTGLVNIGDRFTGDQDENAAIWSAADDAARAAIAKATGSPAEPRLARHEEHPPCPGCLDTECNGECMEVA